jgi:hypothetical protein
MNETPRYCAYCGYRITDSDIETRASGNVELHKACAPKWDAEYQKYREAVSCQ